jgi:hypothetical protein
MHIPEEQLNDLAVLIHTQCASVNDTLFNRACSGRKLTTVALGDIRRTLAHLVKSIDESLAEKKS